MNPIREIWERMEQRARIAIGIGAAVIICIAVELGWWAYRPNYQVLFAELSPRDAAAMTTELDKLKAPYRLDGDGNTILVPQDQVYKLRLKLMGRDAPLYGAVGFEVFNNADLGMSEFVQKVNYQRAIQGELTRTIQAIDEVQLARVHLAIPEQGLFKRGQSRAKASVTLTMKRGATLDAAQVTGIQRLVASSVPDVLQSDVTVLDQHGLALTRAVSVDRGTDGANEQLEAKRSTEDYLAKKLNQVLDRTFGPGEAVATVDVVLNLDQDKVTTEEVLPGRTLRPVQGGAAGVVVRERHSTQGGDIRAPAEASKAAGATESSTSESEYQVGRRVEQLAIASGTVRRLTVAVLVRQALSASQVSELKEVASSALGVNTQRGDVVVVHSMDQFAGRQGDSATVAAAAQGMAQLRSPAGPPAALRQDRTAVEQVAEAVLAALFVIAAVVLLRRARRPRLVSTLDEAGRAAMLLQVRTWIETDLAASSVEIRK